MGPRVRGRDFVGALLDVDAVRASRREPVQAFEIRDLLARGRVEDENLRRPGILALGDVHERLVVRVGYVHARELPGRHRPGGLPAIVEGVEVSFRPAAPYLFF